MAAPALSGREKLSGVIADFEAHNRHAPPRSDPVCDNAPSDSRTVGWRRIDAGNSYLLVLQSIRLCPITKEAARATDL